MAAGEPVGGRVALAGPIGETIRPWGSEVFLFGREAARLSRTQVCAVRGGRCCLFGECLSFASRGLSRLGCEYTYDFCLFVSLQPDE